VQSSLYIVYTMDVCLWPPLQECDLQLLQGIIKVLTLQNHGLPLLFDETELELSFLHVVFSNCCRVPSRFLPYKSKFAFFVESSLWVSPICSYVDGYFCAVLRAIT
jgi:hypothetical protein